MMYRKRNKTLVTIADFIMPFGGKLLADNRWVKLAKMIPWDFIEEVYAKSMCPDNGARAISARIAFGALFIKENERLTDERTVEYIAENPYAQYFLGLHEFVELPLFDPSMMVHFRKRFPDEKVNEINRRIFAAQKRDETYRDGGDGGGSGNGSIDAGSSDEDNETASEASSTNSGKLVLDATCAPADIRYPSDISLLNEARENTEAMIEELWEQNPGTGHKTRYRRKHARSEYLSIAKQKKPRTAKTRKAIGNQLRYISLNLEDISRHLIEHGLDALCKKDIERLITICQLHRQQKGMYESKTHQCEQRIVSLRQPHVRPIVRGKAGRRFEFGQKLALSVVNGYTFMEKQSFENFNEGVTLIDSVKRYRQTYGCYPEVVQADRAYRNHDNLVYCKKHRIRLSGPPLGRRGKNADIDKALEHQDNCERNIIEGRNGMGKRRFGLDLIMAVLQETAATEAAFQLICMNVRVRLLQRLLRFLLDKPFSLPAPAFLLVFQ